MKHLRILGISKKRPVWYNNFTYSLPYGKIYNWFAVTDPRGLAPDGWHIPSDSEWMILINFLGGYESAGRKMKSNRGWKNFSGTNQSGFNGFPAGSIIRSEVSGKGSLGYWWSSSVANASSVWVFRLDSQGDFVNRFTLGKTLGFSVRCIKN